MMLMIGEGVITLVTLEVPWREPMQIDSFLDILGTV